MPLIVCTKNDPCDDGSDCLKGLSNTNGIHKECRLSMKEISDYLVNSDDLMPGESYLLALWARSGEELIRFRVIIP